MKRTPLTIMLPSHLATALTEAARCAGTLDDEGRLVMDHIILARPDTALAVEHMPSQNEMLEVHFNGA